ncbi:MAG: elongation factor Ts [Eggerthellaceae bacterium]|nr:elongation factor Ts [Eggerthellaceae bacterium]
MAEVSASMVKELREMTGVGILECKNALAEADGDLNRAADILREQGIAKQIKKAERAANEGTVVALVSEDGKSGSVIQLNCETDFVAINDKFKAYAERIAQIALANKCEDVDSLKAASDGSESVEEIITDCVRVMGENTQLTKVASVSAGAVCAYIHAGGKIGVLVTFETEGIEPTSDAFVAYGRDVAMQVAAMSPVAANRENVPADVVEHEMEIYKAQAAESGKPEEIQQKMAEGRLEKYYKESCLTEQEFVKNPDQTIKAYTEEVAKQLGGSIKVVDFIRFALGE